MPYNIYMSYFYYLTYLCIILEYIYHSVMLFWILLRVSGEVREHRLWMDPSSVYTKLCVLSHLCDPQFLARFFQM